MDSIAWILGACLLVLTLAVFFLARQLVNTNRELIRWAARCLDHTCAFNADQREFIRDRFDADMARPPRDTSHPHAGHDRGTPMPPRDQSDLITAPIPYEG